MLSKVIVSRLSRLFVSPVQCLSLAGNFIEAAKSKVHLFSSVIFQHIGRSGNFLAHSLAQQIGCDADGDDVLPF